MLYVLLTFSFLFIKVLGVFRLTFEEKDWNKHENSSHRSSDETSIGKRNDATEITYINVIENLNDTIDLAITIRD